MAGHTLKTNAGKAERIIELLEQLDEVTGSFVSVQNGIKDHKESHYIKPETASYADMAEIATKAAAEEREVAAVTRTFRYRPWDGANAVQEVLKTTFGYPGFGKGIQLPFGMGVKPPQRININVGVDETIEVPWGQLEVPDLKAVFHIGAAHDEEAGSLFALTVELPKKFEKAARGLMNAIEDYLKNNSIYKGQAITGADMPEFIDLSRVNRANFVYKSEVDSALEAEIWNPLRYPELYEKDGQPLRWISLLAGGYGTGKTSAAMLTAKVAVENGWTFIQARPGKDDLQVVMSLAHIYAPAVVFYEDLDVVANTPDQEIISTLLEAFDGMRSKGHPVSVMMTTNHPESIHPGLIRAGRLHTFLTFGDLDAPALEHLIRVKVGSHQLKEDLDFAEVFNACEGYSPSFMALVIDLAKRYAFFDWTEDVRREVESENPTWDAEMVGSEVTRRVEAEGAEEFSYKLSTRNLVDASLRLKDQWQLTIDNAGNRPQPARLDNVFTEMVRSEVQNVISSTSMPGIDELFNVDADSIDTTKIGTTK